MGSAWPLGLAGKRPNLNICPTSKIAQSGPLQDTGLVARHWRGVLWFIFEAGSAGNAGAHRTSGQRQPIETNHFMGKYSLVIEDKFTCCKPFVFDRKSVLLFRTLNNELRSLL